MGKGVKFKRVNSLSILHSKFWERHKLAFYDSSSVRQRFSQVLLTPTGFPTDKADLSTSVSVQSKIFRPSSLLAAIVSQFISIRHGARTDGSSDRRSHWSDELFNFQVRHILHDRKFSNKWDFPQIRIGDAISKCLYGNAEYCGSMRLFNDICVDRSGIYYRIYTNLRGKCKQRYAG